jgi:PPOX class probable F420-dependent enzyme
MEISEALAFVRANHRGVLVTFGPSGRVQTSPVVAAVDGDDRVAISSRETAFKVKNLLRDPRATYCGFGDSFFGSWIQVDGRAEIVSLPEAMDGLIAYYREISGDHPDWDEYRNAMERERRVLVRITIERAGPDQGG